MPAPIALLTGATAGLGAATARVFASAGYRLIINYANNAERAKAIVSELKGLSPLKDEGDNVVIVKADLSSRDDIKRLVDESVKLMGGLDVGTSIYATYEIYTLSVVVV